MAKKNDPKYVRLTPRLSRSVISDTMESGWKISGLDVKPFPTGDSPRAKAQQKFVRRQLAAGHLEPCSLAEYEDVQEQAALISSVEATHQEGKFMRAVEEATEKVRASREAAIAGGADGASGEVEDDDEPDDEGEDAEDGDEDEEVEETPKAKKTAAKKAAAKKK